MGQFKKLTLNSPIVAISQANSSVFKPGVILLRFISPPESGSVEGTLKQNI